MAFAGGAAAAPSYRLARAAPFRKHYLFESGDIEGRRCRRGHEAEARRPHLPLSDCCRSLGLHATAPAAQPRLRAPAPRIGADRAGQEID